MIKFRLTKQISVCKKHAPGRAHVTQRSCCTCRERSEVVRKAPIWMTLRHPLKIERGK